MSDNQYDLRCLLTRASLGTLAYQAWAKQARRDRKVNIARLLEALGTAKQVRAERVFGDLGEVGTTARNVDRALGSIEPEPAAAGQITSTSPVGRELLGRAQEALAENRDLRFDEIGDLYVCTTCGNLREEQNVQPCPVCGTVPEAHRAFRAAEAVGTLGPHSIVGFLEHSHAALVQLAHGLEDDMLACRLQERHPSIKELIGHLADMDSVFRERAWLILETNRPALPQAHPPRLDAAAAYREQPAAVVLEAFRRSRQQTLALMRGLTNAAWHRIGRHEVYGELNLIYQGNWVVSHERLHLIEMAQIRHDLILSDSRCCEPVELAEVIVDDIAEGE